MTATDSLPLPHGAVGSSAVVLVILIIVNNEKCLLSIDIKNFVKYFLTLSLALSFDC